MTIGLGSAAKAVTLTDDQLATIKEKAFLMANDEQLDAARGVVDAMCREDAQITWDYADDLIINLDDGRRVQLILDDGTITDILIVTNEASNDEISDVDLYMYGKKGVDRDKNWSTSVDNQSIRQSDKTLFNELAAKLQRLIDSKNIESATLSEQADDNFSIDNQSILNEGAQVVTAFESAGVNNITLTDTRTNTENKKIRLKLSDGKAIVVNFKEDGKTIDNIQIRMSNEYNGVPDNISDIAYFNDGEVLVDPDKNDSTQDGENADRSHIYVSTQASGYDDLKTKVIALLKKKGIEDVQ